MNINLIVSFRGHDLLLTMDIINMEIAQAERDIGFTGALESFEVEEIFITSQKGMRLPTEKVDEALHKLIMEEYQDEVSEAVLSS